jgi:hypothetical protein
MKAISIILLFLVIGCKPINKVVTISDSTYVRVVEKIVREVVELPADSASISALLACDSLGNVFLSEIATLRGRAVAQEAYLHNNMFRVVSTVKPEKEIVTITKDSIVYKYKEKPVEVIIPGRITFMQRAKIFFAGMLVIVVLLVAKRILNLI